MNTMEVHGGSFTSSQRTDFGKLALQKPSWPPTTAYARANPTQPCGDMSTRNCEGSYQRAVKM